MTFKKLLLWLSAILSVIFIFSFSAYAEGTEPTINLTSYNTASGLKLKWEKSETAEKYLIYRKENGKWKKLYETSKLNYTDKNVTDATYYRYRIKTVAADGDACYFYTACRYLTAPEVLSASNSVAGITVTWSKYENTTGFRLLRKKEGENKWKALKTLPSETTSYTDTKVENGVKYSYSLRRLNGEYYSTYIQKGKAKTRTETVKSAYVKNSPKGVKISWKAGENVKSYVISRQTASGKWKTVVTLGDEAISYIDKSVSYGKKINYKIKIISKKGISSAYCNPVSVYAVNPNKPMLALTYDDGPSSVATGSILNTLEQYGARATFFVVGSRIETYPQLIKRQAEIGCEIACHTYNHTILTTVDNSVVVDEITKTNALIEKVSGKRPTLVRAPGGSANQRVMTAAKAPFIQWNIDTRDWEHRNSSRVISSVKGGASDGAIILMHDLYASTATATKSFVPYLINKGYQLVTVSEMFDAKGIELKNGKMYYRS